MAYNDFSLDNLIQQFGLTIREQSDLFGQVASAAISELLRQTLVENVPLAVEISTEKARSELIITPVLMEVRRQIGGNRISLFSGIPFNVDVENGLLGVCDFLLSLSPLQLVVQAPVVTIVEAKNENLNSGIAQCAAEMLAAQRFNRQRQQPIPAIFGVVTTGSNWRFLRLDDSTVTIETGERYIEDVEKIVGILLAMLREAGSS